MRTGSKQPHSPYHTHKGPKGISQVRPSIFQSYIHIILAHTPSTLSCE